MGPSVFSSPLTSLCFQPWVRSTCVKWGDWMGCSVRFRQSLRYQDLELGDSKHQFWTRLASKAVIISSNTRLTVWYKLGSTSPPLRLPHHCQNLAFSKHFMFLPDLSPLPDKAVSQVGSIPFVEDVPRFPHGFRADTLRTSLISIHST